MAESRSLTDKFMLRLPDGLRDRIKVSADMNGRSMNSEIVAILEREFPAPPPSALDYYADALKVTLDRLNVTPPEGMTTGDVVRVAIADLMLENNDLDELGELLRQEAIERQAHTDSINDKTE